MQLLSTAFCLMSMDACCLQTAEQSRNGGSQVQADSPCFLLCLVISIEALTKLVIQTPLLAHPKGRCECFQAAAPLSIMSFHQAWSRGQCMGRMQQLPRLL